MGSDTPHSMVSDKFKEEWNEGLKRKIKNDTEPLKRNRSTYLEKLKKDKENAIYTIIRLYTVDNGITHKKLAAIANLDRKSIRPYIKNLIKNGLVTKNKKKLYVAVHQFHEDPVFKAEVFGHAFLKILKDNKFKILNNEKEVFLFTADQEKMSKYDFTKYKELFEPKFSKDHQVEKILFEFSNRIGAFITYLMIYSMNPENHIQDNLPRENEEIIQRMVRTGLNQVTPFLISYFIYLLDKSLSIYQYDHDKSIKFNEGKSRYLLQEKVIIKLLSAFKKIYPMMTYEFENISDKRYFFKEVLEGWTSVIDDYKYFLDLHKETLKKRETCRHVYEEKTVNGSIIRQCKLCNNIIKSKKSRSTKNLS